MTTPKMKSPKLEIPQGLVERINQLPIGETTLSRPFLWFFQTTDCEVTIDQSGKHKTVSFYGPRRDCAYRASDIEPVIFKLDNETGDIVYVWTDTFFGYMKLWSTSGGQGYIPSPMGTFRANLLLGEFDRILRNHLKISGKR